MVKSRRMASSRHSVVNVTFAWRPNVSMSAAQRRHLERHLAGDDRHRAVLDAGRNGVQPGAIGEAHDVARQRRGRDVDILHRSAHQRVAHRAADGARLGTLRRQRGEYLARLRPGQPIGIRQAWQPGAIVCA